jgi:hypothetical protein
MSRKLMLDLGPALVLAAGVLASTWLAVRLGTDGAWVMLAPLVLAASLVGADRWRQRLGAGSSILSPGSMIMTAAILIAGLIVTLHSPGLVANLIPIVGACAGFIVSPPQSRDRHEPCRIA